MQQYTALNSKDNTVYSGEQFHITFRGNNVSNLDFLKNPVTEKMSNRMTGYLPMTQDIS